MFGFNKNKRLIEGPVEFSAEVEIARSVQEIFPLIDLADPRFLHTQLGAQVRPVDGSEDRFEMTSPDVDDMVFHFTVLESIEGEKQALECVIKPQLLALHKSVETYVIKPRGENACHVELTTSATFDPSLSDEEVAGEIAIMSAAVASDLEKLRALAEEGVEAAKAIDEDLGLGFEFGDDFDFNDLGGGWDEIEPEQ